MKHFLSVLFLLAMQSLAFGQNTILWQVTDTVNHKTSYLLGTFHQFGNSFVDSLPQIQEALLRSELAVFESIDGVEATRKMIQARKPGTGVEKVLNKRDFARLKEIAKDWQVDLYRLSPFEIRLKLSQEFQRIQCGTTVPGDTFDHFDNYLMHLAGEHKIRMLGLETDSQQLALLEQGYKNPSWRKEGRMIRAWIRQLTTDRPDRDLCALADRYRRFDLDYNFDLSCENDILILQRNRDWMEVLPQLLRSTNTFVAVGFLHLMWQCGLLEQLREQGFQIVPVALEGAGQAAG